MDVFGVFEGGGAKGFAHVGALRAAERRGFRFRAVAGTSIGALIAALVAAGFDSHDLFRVDDGEEAGLLSDDLEREFLDEKEYGRILRLRRDIETLLQRPEDGIRSYFWSHIASSFRLSWVLGVAVANLSFIPMALHRSVLGDLWWHAGAVGTTKVRDWIDRTLREKLGLPSGSAVRFLDLPIELRVVATDLTAGDLCVFGRATTPDVPVADAVTASMAYPLFFKPVHIKGSVFVDGGLTSNGPSWVLDDLRDAADARTPTFAFRLLDPLPMLPASPARARLWLGQAARRCLALAPAPPSRRPRLGPLAGRFIVSSLNSRSSLETRKIDDLHLVELRAGVSTLDFDVVNANKAATVQNGERGVTEYLSRRIGPRNPVLMERLLRALAALVAKRTNDDGVVRAYVLQQVDPILCRVVYAAVLEGEADDALTFRSESNSQALCLHLKEPVLMRVSALPTADRRRAATKYLHAARPADITHVYCVPIFPSHDAWNLPLPSDRPIPVAGICFDFRSSQNEALLLEPDIEDLLAAMAQTAGEFWSEMHFYGPAALPEQAGDAQGDWTMLPLAPGYFISDRKPRARVAEAVSYELDEVVSRIGSEKMTR